MSSGRTSWASKMLDIGCSLLQRENLEHFGTSADLELERLALSTLHVLYSLQPKKIQAF